MADRIVTTGPSAGVVVTATHRQQVILDGKAATNTFVEDDPDILVVESKGPRGDPGGPGPAGPPGADGPQGQPAKSLYDIWLEAGNPADPDIFFRSVGRVGYRFVQVMPAMTWEVTHPLETGMPAVSLVDSAGEEMYGDVAYLPPHRLTINFTAPVAGEAYLT